MDLELKRKIVNVKLDGKSYALTVPNLREAESYQEKVNLADKEGKYFDLVCDFLKDRGLPEDVVSSLEIDHVNLIIENLLGVKKN